MNFVDALLGAVRECGWEAELSRSSHGEVGIEATDYNNRRNRGQISVRLDLLKDSWDKWSEEKQDLGKEKLKKTLPSVLQEFTRRAGMRKYLDSSYWTP